MLKNLQDVPAKHRMSAISAEKKGKQYTYFLLQDERGDVSYWRRKQHRPSASSQR